VLNEKQAQEIRTSSMTNSMSMNSLTMNANRVVVVSRSDVHYPYRDEAVGALQRSETFGRRRLCE
jgi:hypothetical protein